jgi:N-acetylglutamate synthase-like GNAT family acetyltransferase
VVKWIERFAHPTPDRIRAGRRQLLSDDDLREPRESRVSAAQRWHPGSREDDAKPRILLHHFGDRALEVGLGLEVTNYKPRQRILTISGNIFCPSRIKAKSQELLDAAEFPKEPGPMTMLIRRSVDADLPAMLAIINDAARAYRGVIPVDRWHEPYMPEDELAKEIDDGVAFWVAEKEGQLSAVMGIQDKGDVALVRHAYVASTTQRTGVGTTMLHHVEKLTDKPILIGTWASASWAVGFYQRNGFTLLPSSESSRLLKTYWSIPARQIETSVVLADGRWMESQERVR